MKRSLGLSRSKGSKVLAKRQTDKLDSSKSLSFSSCNEVDSGLSSAEEDKSQSGDGSSGTFKVQLFRQSPSTSSSSMVSDAHQPESAWTSALSENVNQTLESNSTSAPRTTLVSSVPSVCLPSTSSTAVSASSSSSSPSKHAPIQFSLKRPANDAKPTTSKKLKSKGVSQNIPLITSFFKKRSDTSSAASHTRHSTDSDSSDTDEEDVEGSDENQPDPRPSTSNHNIRQPKLPVNGSKDYNRCLENWNIFKEMEELIATRPDLTQKQRQEIVASQRNMTCRNVRYSYEKTRLQIEMSGKAISSDHSLDNELFQMLTISKSEVNKFSKAKVAAANDKDKETARNSKTNTRKYAINRFKKGSHDYNRILSSWETYKEVEALRTSQPDLERNKDRCQFLATNKNVPLSTIFTKFKFVQERINLEDQYISVNHPFDDELIRVLATPYRQLTKQQKTRPFSDLQTDDEKAEVVKKTFEQALDFNVPPNEHFLFAAKLLNTTDRQIRISFVKSKVSECKEMRVETTTALRAIRQESIKTLANLHISQLCELTAREKTILGHFEPAAEPFSVKCTLPHNRDGGSIGFTLYCRQMLLYNVKNHCDAFHYDFFTTLEKTSAPLQPVRPDVHRLYSTLIEALNYPTFVSHLIILSNLTRLPDSTVAAEKVFISDDDHTLDFPTTATGIDAQDKWIFSFFRLSESEDQFKCRLWHQKDSSKVVPSEVYFKDGLLIEKHLYHHLNSYHGIANNFGSSNDSYRDAPSGQTISLKSMPIETFNLLTRLLDTDQMPFQDDCNNSIDANGNIYPLENSHTNASELSSFVKELSEDEFKVLSLFKPSKSTTEVHCRLHHKTRFDTVSCSRGTTMKKDTVLFALKSHLTNAHRMTIESRENKTEVVNGKSKITLIRMPLDTIAWFFKVAHGKVDKQSLETNNLIIPLATHSLSDEDEDEDEDELKADPNPWVEIAMIKCMPSAYFSIANCPKELSKTLKLSQKIRNAIVGLDRSTNASNARNYLVFMKAVTSSVHDFIDAILYGGFTDGKLADSRIRTYVKDVQLLIDGKQTLDQLKEDKNKEMLGSMVACWRAGSESYAHYLTENRWMTQSEALFTERSVIAALKYLPINCNKLHGSTASYSEVLTKHNITEQLICKAGIAELVLFYQKHQFDRHFATPVQINNDHITRTPSPTPKYLLSSGVLETIQIPPYSLICPPLPIDLHKHYAVHLFMALFTLPVKDTFWYLNRSNSNEHINLLDESHRNEVTESINSVLSFLSFDFDQCLQWAQQLWHTIFVANVEAANRELGNTASRHPASKQTHRHNVDFISISALLLSKVIGLKDENGDEYMIKSFELPTIEFLENPGTYQVGEVPVYNKLQLFTDLAHIDFPPLDNFIKPGDKPQHTVTPLDPFPDDALFNKFFASTIFLKHFNFEGTLPKQYYLVPQFKILPFLWASRFHRII